MKAPWLCMVVLLLVTTFSLQGVYSQPAYPQAVTGYGFGELLPSAAALNMSQRTEAAGYYLFNLDVSTGDLDIHIFATGLIGNVTSITLNCGLLNNTGHCSPGSTCDICVNLSDLTGSTDLPLDLSINVVKELVDALRDGSIYFQISTDVFPNGELQSDKKAPCTMFEGKRLDTPNLRVVPRVQSAAACCALCEEDLECQTFAWNRSNFCHLKASTAQVVSDAVGYISGLAPYPVFFSGSPDFKAEMTSSTSPHHATVLLISVDDRGTYAIAMHDTLPESLLPPDAQLLMGVAGQGTWMPVMDIVGSTQTDIATVTLTQEQLDALSSFQLQMYIRCNVSQHSLTGVVHPTNVVPITAVPQGMMGAAVYPPNRRGADGASVTIAVHFGSVDIGNEVWVTLPEGFDLNSEGSTSINYYIGVSPPSAVVVMEDERQVQLRWADSDHVPFLDDPFMAFTITNVELPNNCDPKEYIISTATCSEEDFLNAGIVFQRKCIPNPNTDVVIKGAPVAGSPTGCQPGGCNACKFLYTSSATSDRIYSCEHQGQTIYRINLPLSEPCQDSNMAHRNPLVN